ncbi:MAG TPA: hypothetical protein VHN37_02075 [Actinomycetota bacterium]|nr:hypothetical protein [Actinomycetota bacterium]
MRTDLRLAIANRPGTLARACDVLAEAGVHVEGVSGDLRPGEKWGYVHVLVDDSAKAHAALDKAGIEVIGEHRVELVEIPPGDVNLGEIVTSYTGPERNMEVFYPTLDGRLAIGTEDMRADRPGVRMGDARY